MNSPSGKKRTSLNTPAARRMTAALTLCAMLLLSGPASVFSQNTSSRTAVRPRPTSPAKSTKPTTPRPAPRQSQTNEDGTITAGLIVSDPPVEATSASITRAMATLGPAYEKPPRPRKARVQPDRSELPEAPGALEESQWPPADPGERQARLGVGEREGEDVAPSAPQTLGTSFDGATGPTETGAFPPDTMGTVGPTQYFVFLNGRLRTFNKTTGVADGVINADSDVFFASVMTPAPAGRTTFTSDPQVRYDRHSGRWFLNIIDVTVVNATGALNNANRILIAVSDAASNGVITAATVWTFYQFQGDATLFTDYQSLGIDSDALYIGGDMFTIAGAFQSTKGFVIPKAPLLTASPATVWAFSGMVATPTGAGPFAPRGVDNFDPANTGPTAIGYFIGVDNATFNTLMARRVTNPGSLGPAPTMSANIAIATPLTTRFPVTVNHLGDTGGTAGNLDALDDRLFAAMMHRGRLWTAHNIGVNNTGVAGASNNRNASRWYEIQNMSATPSIVQSGTLYDNTAPNDGNQRSYWIPSIAVSGQGHAAMGTSIAGTNERINAFTTGRLSGDTLGTMRDGPGGAALPGYTASSTAYNPPGDPGGPRRWGDYSFTSVDPLDDMTMWTIQEYCNGTNTYGVRVVKLIAPPPATPTTASPLSVPAGQTAVNVVITGTSVAGSGFYDPGTDLAPPALPFNHISATVTGGVTVNSTTYDSPTQVTLNVSTVGATPGPQTVTITNPDGQSAVGTAAITVTASAPAATVGQVVINEFRFRGAGGAADEFVELYNTTSGPLDISGYTLHALTGAGAQALRHTVPGALGSSTTVIPARGHYLITGASYSLAAVAASNGALSTGIVDGSGIGFFAGPTPTAPTRIDSAGFDNRDALFFEGTPITPSGAGTGGIIANGEYSFVRKVPTTPSRVPQDTGDNDADFTFVSTTAGTFTTRVSALGAPGPENLAGPVDKTFTQFNDALLDPLQGATAVPNRVRTSRAACGAGCDNTKSNLGTVEFRRRFTNNTGGPVTRLRFRITEITTLNNRLPTEADYRALNATGNFLVSTSSGNVTVERLTLEAPSDAVTNGGGLNSSVSAGTITMGNALANGSSINVNFLFGVQQIGDYRVFITVEALP